MNLLVLVFGALLLSLTVASDWLRLGSERSLFGRIRSRTVWETGPSQYIGPRQAAAVVLPIAAFLIAVSVAMIAEDQKATLVEAVAWVAIFVALAATVASLKWPMRFVPAWLADEWRRRDDGLDPVTPPPPEGLTLTMTRRQLVLNVAFGAVIAVAFVAAGASLGPVLTGLGFGLAALSRYRIRST